MPTNVNTVWAVDLVATNALVLHKPTSVVGKVQRFYAPGEYVSPLNDQPLDAYALEILTSEGAHVLLAVEENYLALSQAAAKLFIVAMVEYTRAMLKVAETAKQAGVDDSVARALMFATVTTQRNLLQK